MSLGKIWYDDMTELLSLCLVLWDFRLMKYSIYVLNVRCELIFVPCNVSSLPLFIIPSIWWFFRIYCNAGSENSWICLGCFVLSYHLHSSLTTNGPFRRWICFIMLSSSLIFLFHFVFFFFFFLNCDAGLDINRQVKLCTRMR